MEKKDYVVSKMKEFAEEEREMLEEMCLYSFCEEKITGGMFIGIRTTKCDVYEDVVSIDNDPAKVDTMFKLEVLNKISTIRKTIMAIRYYEI